MRPCRPVGATSACRSAQELDARRLTPEGVREHERAEGDGRRSSARRKKSRTRPSASPRRRISPVEAPNHAKTSRSNFSPARANRERVEHVVRGGGFAWQCGRSPRTTVTTTLIARGVPPARTGAAAAPKVQTVAVPRMPCTDGAARIRHAVICLPSRCATPYQSHPCFRRERPLACAKKDIGSAPGTSMRRWMTRAGLFLTTTVLDGEQHRELGDTWPTTAGPRT